MVVSQTSQDLVDVMFNAMGCTKGTRHVLKGLFMLNLVTIGYSGTLKQPYFWKIWF